MKNITLSIDGRKVTCPSGASILSAAEQHGIRIPTLCHHPDLKPYGACRMCLVEDEKTGRLMASCVTPALPDLLIRTDTPRILNHRKNIVRLMIAEHPESCLVCGKGNRCELRRIAAQLGVAEPRLYPMPNHKPFETLNPFIVRDLGKCILCGKCIRADHELVVAGAIDYNDRGFNSRPATLHEQPLENSRCTFCGTCVSMCPTGALSVKNSRFVGTPGRESVSICGFCGAGCTLSLGVSGNRVVEVNPAPDRNTVNGPTLCVRGHFAHDFLDTPDRLTRPMIRATTNTGETMLKPSSWDEALGMVGARLAEIKRTHGPESIAFIGSTRCTNEENYLFQKIARAIFETGNVISGGSINGQALLRRIEEKTFGAQRITPLADLEGADAIVTVLIDPEQIVPVAGYPVKRAAKRGVPLVVIDPQGSDLSGFATAWLRPESDGGTIDAVNELALGLIDDTTGNNEFIGRYTAGFPDYVEALNATKPPQSLAESIRKASALLKNRKIAFVLAPDLLERENGEAIFDAVFNLALVTGSIGPKGAGFFIPTTENNLRGALDMGTVPDLLPGRRPIDNETERASVEAAWGNPVPSTAGLDLSGLVEAAESGRLKAVYIMSENPVRDFPDPARMAAALDALDFVVVQDIVLNRTVRRAHVVLPGAAFAEKNGSFTNMEGRIQAFGPAVEPPGSALPDWTILGMLARRMGYPEQYTTIEKIRQEIRRVVPMYAELGNHRCGWVRNEESTPLTDNTLRFAFAPVRTHKTATGDREYPFTACIGYQRWHLGGGTRTSRSHRINASGHHGEIEISPANAAALALSAGGRVRLTSAAGSVERGVRIRADLPEGHCIVPLGFCGNDAMQLVGFDRLAAGWRTCRVRIETLQVKEP